MTGVTIPDTPPRTDRGSGRDDPPGSGPDESGDGRPGRSRGPSLWQLIALGVAVCLLAGIVGWRIGDTNPSHPSTSSVDVGFFYDMSAHHQQALTMALDYIRNGDDPRLLQMAREIVTYQSSEIGAMNTWLTQWGHVGDAPAKAMGWMQPPIPQRDARARDEGADGSARGGPRLRARQPVHRADDQPPRGRHPHGGVRGHPRRRGVDPALAAAMDDGQRGEISEMNQWRTQHGLKTIVPPLAEFTPAVGS